MAKINGTIIKKRVSLLWWYGFVFYSRFVGLQGYLSFKSKNRSCHFPLITRRKVPSAFEMSTLHCQTLLSFSDRFDEGFSVPSNNVNTCLHRLLVHYLDKREWVPRTVVSMSTRCYQSMTRVIVGHRYEWLCRYNLSHIYWNVITHSRLQFQ